MARRLRLWGPWAAVVLLASALISYHGALERANTRVDRLRPYAVRSHARDLLIGTDVSDVRLASLDGRAGTLGETAGRQVVWFVDPRRCAGCLDDLRAWKALRRTPGVTASIVLTEVPRERARRIRHRAGLPDRVRWTSGDGLGVVLGVPPGIASLFLVVDADGTVRMAEARHSDHSCDWSFARQATALLDGRPVPPTRSRVAGLLSSSIERTVE